MKIMIGGMDSAGGAYSDEVSTKLVQLGKAIAEHGCILKAGNVLARLMQRCREPKLSVAW